ncbi:hypothetical protein TrLO_g6128 [Triparma laevis f. longispina]|uniref:Uncharacterized protein n=1 Tax=Triparma laevis f. longispina TaxID=1714387 RepID=A0A9W7A5K9_9STRA|nr:hypothetical protein TrLO_g6128 [Triparma laevis f. longispina]
MGVKYGKRDRKAELLRLVYDNYDTEAYQDAIYTLLIEETREVFAELSGEEIATLKFDTFLQKFSSSVGGNISEDVQAKRDVTEELSKLLYQSRPPAVGIIATIPSSVWLEILPFLTVPSVQALLACSKQSTYFFFSFLQPVVFSLT